MSGNVFQFQTDNDGDIEILPDGTTTNGGLATAVYLSMFGGNMDDPALSDTSLSWWGNIDAPSQSYQYRSRTQYLLRNLVSISSNLLRLEDAVRQDLQWMIDEGIASNLSVAATLVAPKRVNLTITITATEVIEIRFLANWQADTGGVQ